MHWKGENHMYLSEIKKVQDKLQLRIEKETPDGNFEHALTTKSSLYTREFLRSLRYHIKKATFFNDDLKLVLDDDGSEVYIEDYNHIKTHPSVRSLDIYIERFLKKKRIQQKIRNLAVSASIAILGLTGFSLKNKGIDTVSSFINEIAEEDSMEEQQRVSLVNEKLEDMENLRQESIARKEYEQAYAEDVKRTQGKVEEWKKQAEEEEKLNAVYSSIPTLGEKIDDGKLEYVQDHYKNIISELSKTYAIDERILQCLFAQESKKHVPIVNDNGAIGISQIQYNWHVNNKHTLYRTDGTIETFTATDDVLRDLVGNMKTGISILQQCLQKYKGNLFLSLQAYNYGDGAIDECLNITSSKTGQTVEEIIRNPYNLTWLETVQEYKDGRYGDPNFVENVLSRFSKDEIDDLCKVLENSIWRDESGTAAVGYMYQEDSTWKFVSEDEKIDIPNDAYSITIQHSSKK